MSDRMIMELAPMVLMAFTTIFILAMVLCYRVIRMVVQSRHGGVVPGNKAQKRRDFKDGPVSQESVEALADRALELARRIENLEEILKSEKIGRK